MTRLATAAALAVLVPSTLLFSTPATAVVETCQGRPATIVGTGSTVVGTPGDDVIVTGTAATVQADAGNDLICVTASTVEGVEIDAGDGDDIVDGTASTTSTRTLLRAGRDRFLGGPGRDSVHGEGTDDDVSGGDGNDALLLFVTDPAGGTPGGYDGGAGSDWVSVWSPSLDVELVLNGTVFVAGVPAAATTSMRNGNVVAPRAVLRGDDQDNILEVRGCDSEAYGGLGDDALDGGFVSETNPRFECKDRSRLVGGPGDDAARGSNGRDKIVGGAGEDELDGRGSGDLLLGGAGTDFLDGGGENDVLRGGAGNDAMDGQPGRDTLLGNGGRDSADGDRGRDRCVAEKQTHCER